MDANNRGEVLSAASSLSAAFAAWLTTQHRIMPTLFPKLDKAALALGAGQVLQHAAVNTTGPHLSWSCMCGDTSYRLPRVQHCLGCGADAPADAYDARRCAFFRTQHGSGNVCLIKAIQNAIGSDHDVALSPQAIAQAVERLASQGMPSYCNHQSATSDVSPQHYSLTMPCVQHCRWSK